jgi:hypothetical protein
LILENWIHIKDDAGLQVESFVGWGKPKSYKLNLYVRAQFKEDSGLSCQAGSSTTTQPTTVSFMLMAEMEIPTTWDR